jgi:hypothetical protein
MHATPKVQCDNNLKHYHQVGHFLLAVQNNQLKPENVHQMHQHSHVKDKCMQQTVVYLVQPKHSTLHI